mgnify:FL=1
MGMEHPQTMFELGDWCLRKLGGDNIFQRPVGGIQYINITKQQVIDRLKEAVFRFNNEHFNGYREVGLILNLEQGKSSYELPHEITSVLYYLKLNDKSTMFSFDYQMRQSMGMNWGKLGGFDLVTVELAYEWLKMVDMMVGKKFNYTFNQLTHEFNLLTPIDSFDGASIALVCYMQEDTEKYPDVWGDVWLREYSFQLIKQQYAQNLKKFDNVNLPGGITLTAGQMWQEATDRLKELEEQLETKYSFPPMFFVG